MGYREQRDAILVHAQAAAAAVDADWLDVSIGAPIPRGDRSVRVYYGGETEPARMGGNRVLNGELVGERVMLAAFFEAATLGEDEQKAIDDEMYAFKHELRARVLGDSTLGGLSTDLVMNHVQPEDLVIGGKRWVQLLVEFVSDYTEYAIAP